MRQKRKGRTLSGGQESDSRLHDSFLFIRLVAKSRFA
jgi:hypothetical protein